MIPVSSPPRPAPSSPPPSARAGARTFGALLSGRIGREVDVGRLAESLHLNRGAALDALDAVEGAFHDVFGIRFLSAHRPWFESGGGGAPPATDDAGIPDRVALDPRLLDLLDVGHAPMHATAPPPRLDGDLPAWIAAIAASARSGDGLHLAFRRRSGSDRGSSDLAALLAVEGVDLIPLGCGHRALATGLLRAELHAARRPAVVLVETGGLLVDAGGDADDGLADGRSPADASPFALEAMPWLGVLRPICIWCVPLDAILPVALDGMIAGLIGPIRPEASWVGDVVADAVGGDVGPAGVAAIAATLEDPRDAPARGRAARLLSATGMGIDGACAAVARSFVPSSTMPVGSVDFDLGLHADDPEIAMLFARAREVALAGGRLLFHGPPGGGKTTLGRALAAEMAKAGAAGPPLTVTAATICVRPYGGTERILKELWRRAAIARSPLVIDELDAMCGVRDASAPSGGNAYLVRMLTDEWIRNLDAHPQVPVLATVNDLAVDPAILRRFTSHHHVGGALSPELERRAWASLLGVEPPPGWRPCGAAPSDFDAARRRCRMLGLEDAASLAASVERAREARCGSRPGMRRPASAGPLH